MYIIPVHKLDSVNLVGFALCKCENPLVDSDVVAHFPSDATGKEIKKVALEFGYVDSEDCIKWSEKIIEI